MTVKFPINQYTLEVLTLQFLLFYLDYCLEHKQNADYSLGSYIGLDAPFSNDFPC